MFGGEWENRHWLRCHLCKLVVELSQSANPQNHPQQNWDCDCQHYICSRTALVLPCILLLTSSIEEYHNVRPENFIISHIPLPPQALRWAQQHAFRVAVSDEAAFADRTNIFHPLSIFLGQANNQPQSPSSSCRQSSLKKCVPWQRA